MKLYGASGHAKVIIDILNACNINISEIYDDNHNEIVYIGIKRHCIIIAITDKGEALLWRENLKQDEEECPLDRKGNETRSR